MSASIARPATTPSTAAHTAPEPAAHRSRRVRLGSIVGLGIGAGVGVTTRRAAVFGALATVLAFVAIDAGLVSIEIGASRLLAWGRLALALAAGLAVSVVDVRERRIPNAVTYPVVVAMLASAATESIALAGATPPAFEPNSLVPIGLAALGALALGAPFFALAWFGTLGFGDVKLAAMLGAGLLPIAGWQGLVLAFVAAYVLALPHALVALVRRRIGGRAHDHELPFGPYLMAGTLVAVAARVVAG